ncbi:MAG: hypothetical protein J5U19_15805 [Candidatus Methanoperedens sp.]|nr:hypothetical protein [Candidatus Methanoperedens sp.]
MKRRTRRQQPKNLEIVIQSINPVIRGWGNRDFHTYKYLSIYPRKLKKSHCSDIDSFDKCN